MQTIRRVKLCAFVGCLILSAGAVRAFQGAAKVYIDGQYASSDVRTINGKTYIPLADVAKALNLSVERSEGSIKLVKAGGANQAGKYSGVIGGKEFFSGKFRFWARSITQTDEYVQKYHGSHDKITPRDGETLYVVDCRIKNAMNSDKGIAIGDASLTDDQEHSFGPYATDRSDTVLGLLPGSAKEFAFIFSVPKGTVLKDFVYQIQAILTPRDPAMRFEIPK